MLASDLIPELCLVLIWYQSQRIRVFLLPSRLHLFPLVQIPPPHQPQRSQGESNLKKPLERRESIIIAMARDDRGITVFSLDGHLFPVEYALEIVRKGNTIVGVRDTDTIVHGIEKKATPKLQDSRSVRKIVSLDNHIALACVGLKADAASQPPGNPRKRRPSVLDEDTYVAAVEKIFRHDFFPDIPKLCNHLDWLETIHSGDPVIRDAQLKILERRAIAGTGKTPSATRFGSDQTPAAHLAPPQIKPRPMTLDLFALPFPQAAAIHRSRAAPPPPRATVLIPAPLLTEPAGEASPQALFLGL